MRPPLAGLIAVAVAAGPAAAQTAVQPARVISLIPSVTDLIVAMGARERLVARTRYDVDPTLARLPSVGGTIDPSLERIVMIRPDLVLVWKRPRNPRVEAVLSGAGIRFEPMGTETLAHLRDAVARLGLLLHLERPADSLRRAIDDTLAAVRRAASRRRPLAVFYLMGVNPLLTAGPGTFVDELIEIAGGRNIFGDIDLAWPVVSLEAVVDRDPDVIVWPRAGDDADGQQALARLPGWNRLAAVQLSQVILVDRDLLARPGPDVGTVARLLARRFERIQPGKPAREARRSHVR